MGKASSSKKVARAARAAGKGGKRRNLASFFTVIIAAVVVIGILLIVLSRGKTEDSVAPKLGDHWHAAFGIYDCDHFIPNLTDELEDKTGLHSHGDGLMHMHPFGTRYTGTGANIGNWGITTGLEVSDDSIKASGIDRTNGDKCGANAATVQLKVWDSASDETGRLITEDLADYAPQEFSIWVLAFVPEGTDIPKPPPDVLANLQAPPDVVGSQTPQITIPPTGDATTIPPTDATTTVPGSTETTAPGDTTPSTEPSTTVTTTAP